jgi:hypothetical protein
MSGALLVSVATPAAAQSQPSAPTAPAQSTPEQPAPVSPAPAQAAPTSPPAQGYPPAGYAPPPQYYWAPPSYPPPAPPADTPPETVDAALKRGPYFGAWVGAGGPFGGDTTLGSSAGYKEGVGVLGTVGWAFIPNFGIGAFLHYNRTSLAIPPRAQDDLANNSAYGLFYGLEARGMAGAGPLLGWASLGISLGTGNLSFETTQSSASPGSSNNGSVGNVSFKPMPVLSFGVEVEVTKGLALGPQLRWYIVSVDSACVTSTRQVAVFDPNTGQIQTDPNTGLPVTSARTNTDCASGISEVTVPDILFAGVGLTYRIGT